VPGGGTVDTVWISPDGKLIAAARTTQHSDIFVWNTANRDHLTTLTVPEMKIGTSAYPTMVENIAFSADGTSMTMIGYPQSVTSAGKQSYILYQWNLAGGTPTTLWKIIQTPSNISFSSDNSMAVESEQGSVEVVRLLPSPGNPSPLTIPAGSALSYTTSYDLDLNGMRMLYSPARDTYYVWDFTDKKLINHWKSIGISYLSPDGKTALVSYYGANAETLSPVPDLVNAGTMARITPGDSRWQQQMVSSTPTIAYVTYSTDGTVIATERAGGKTDLWSSATGKYLLTISDPTYRDDSDYTVVGPDGREVVIFGDKAAGGDHQFHQLYIWGTGLS
jgi:WD40 repeat protein